MTKSKEWVKRFFEAVGDDELAKCFYPRRIQTPAGYENPVTFAAQSYVHGSVLRHALDTRTFQELSDCDKAIAASCINGIKYGWPTYFVQEEFIRAVVATNPPEDFKVSELHWPLNSMLLCLPVKFMEEYTNGGRFPFIHASFINAGEISAALGGNDKNMSRRKLTIELGSDIVSFCFPLFSEHKIAIDYATWTPPDKSVAELASASFTDTPMAEDARQRLLTEEMRKDYDQILNKYTPEQDAEISRKITSLGIKLMLAITARREYVEHTDEHRKEVVRSGKVVKDAIWHPNWIGRTYKSKYECKGGTHASPKMHWRVGHWRNQAFGKNHSQRKLLWIEPVLVDSTKENHEKENTQH